jgi:hypothetical protein
MVKVAIVDGMKIYVYANDHGRPHFHILAAEYRAVVDIETMRLIRGRLPKARLRKLLSWAKPRQVQLLEAWDRARSGQPVKRIV